MKLAPCLLALLPLYGHAQTDSTAVPLTIPATTAVVRLKAGQFNQGNILDPLQLAQGKVAGLSVTRPGSDPNGRFTTRIRGLSSYFSNTEPLIVLNGVPGASLQLIDPEDITAITVLKDAAATARFGMRSAAGVLLVETRQGDPGRIGITYSAQLAVDQAASRYKVLDAGAFLQAGGEDLSPNAPANTDWQDQVLRTGLSQAHHLQAGGGLGNGTFSAALHYRNAAGILRESGLQQYSGHVAFQQSLWKNRIALNASLLAARRNAGLGFPEAYRYALTFNPSAPVRSDDPQWADYGGYVQPALFDYFNPLAMLDQNAARQRTNRLLANLGASVRLFEGFSLNGRVAQERQNGLQGEFYSAESQWRSYGQNGSVRRTTQEQSGNFLDVNGVYQFNLSSNALVQLTGGYSWQRFEYEASDSTATGLFGLTRDAEPSEFESLTMAAATTNGLYAKGKNTLAAFYGSARLNLRDRWFLEIGLRREGSSRLGKNQRWGEFPYISGGADIGKLLAIKVFKQLKLRAGYGISGQQPPADGLSRQILSPYGAVYYNGAFIQGYAATTNENPDLKWEEKREFNLGLDATLAGGRLSASVDYFTNTSTDLILRKQVSVPPNLANQTYLNAVELSAKGLEASLHWNNILKSGKLDWSAGVLYAHYAITVDKNGYDAPLLEGSPGAPGMGSTFYTVVADGQALGRLWGPVRSGVNSDGSLKYQDLDRNGYVSTSTIEVYNQDQTQLGSGLPGFELGVQNTLRWRHFDLNLFLRGAFGHDLVHEQRLFYENNLPGGPGNVNQVRTSRYDPRVIAFGRLDNTFVENASFLRLDNATLGYTFRLGDKNATRRARVYAGGQNLLLFTGYTGLDPEVRLDGSGPTDNGGRSFSGDPFVAGIDRRNTYPLARTVFVGISVYW